MKRLLVSHATLAMLGAVLAGAIRGQETARVVVVATTDVHGRVTHWDYEADRESPWGLTRAATVVDSLRRRYPDQVLLVDAGDLIQGNPFATYFATVQPIDPHPVIDALNALGYDAATPGNHEFDFGLEVLERAGAGARFSIVSGNVYRLPRDTLIFPRYDIISRAGVRVGVTGFTTPGVMVWNRHHLASRVLVRSIFPEARRSLLKLDSAGADLRLVIIHSGMGEGSSYDTVGVGPENVAAELAGLELKPHLVVVGHSHRHMRDSVIDGVHFIQPDPWARSLAVAHVWLERPEGAAGWRVQRIQGELVSLEQVPPNPAVTRRLDMAHQRVRVWANAPLGRVEEGWSARYARVQDTPIIDFVNQVQRRAGGADLSSTAAFNTAARFGPGAVRLRDVAALYPYENTLKVVRIDGASLRRYLEKSAEYFLTYQPGQPIINQAVPGYNFDIVSGVSYVLDLSRPPGSRVLQLTYQGRQVSPADTFTLALNNYRQAGGGGFDMLVDLPLVHDRGENIRDLLAEAIRTERVLRTQDYFTESWRLIPPDALAQARRAFESRP